MIIAILRSNKSATTFAAENSMQGGHNTMRFVFHIADGLLQPCLQYRLKGRTSTLL